MFCLTSDGWCYIIVAGKSLLVFPERGSMVWFVVQRCAHRSAACPCGCSEACHFISLQLSAVPSCFLSWCTSLPMQQIPPSMENYPQQFHADYFRAHLEIPPLCSTALCFTKSESGPFSLYNPIFISIKVHDSFHLISVASCVLCKQYCPTSSLFIPVATFWWLW